jgi:hydroxymethylpyrimidine pyrophosphatase-like HAD family hydrolase
MAQSTGNRVRAFATDFDGTIAHHGTVPDTTLAALDRLRQSGVLILMVTGRELEDLARIFPHMDHFDLIIGENGALLYSPKDRVSQLLAEPPPSRFVDELMARGVSPISVGHVIVATWEPHQGAVIEVIREMGLEYHIIFNKGAVMVLPPSVNKASGLETALQLFKISPAQTVAVGDAENDHAMLDLCRFPVAVANALPALKERAKYITTAERGEGVAELIEMLLQPGFTLP